MDDQPGPAAFDAADPEDLARELRVCLHAEEWVQQVLLARPYRTLAAIEEAALEAADALSDDGLAEALQAHPRIGERPDGDDAEAAHSRREQGGVVLDDTVAARLHRANVAYESHFGHVFLIRAAGRSAEEILVAAQDRLGNDPATEAAVVRRQLGEIAVLRLRDLLARLVVEAGTRPDPQVSQGTTP